MSDCGVCADVAADGASMGEGEVAAAIDPPRTPIAVLTSTWMALLAPRRLVPILVIAGPLAATQAYTGASVVQTLFLCVLVIVFLLVAPASWRLAVPPTSLSAVAVTGRILLYAAVGAACVWSFGAVLPWMVTNEGDALPVLDVSGAVTMTLWWVGGWGLGRDVESEAGLVAERRRSELLRKEAEAARLLAVKNHLDPHFLFNTLNAIAEWCRTDGAVAERAVLQLSSMLRTILEGVKQPTWPLQKELDLVSALFALHQMRDPDLFTWSITKHGDTDAVTVPPLLLLPLCENAIKHGPARGHRGAVSVVVDAAADAVSIVVDNPGPFAGRRYGGDGLAIVEGRLAVAYVGASFAIAAVDDGSRTRATLRLPREVA